MALERSKTYATLRYMLRYMRDKSIWFAFPADPLQLCVTAVRLPSGYLILSRDPCATGLVPWRHGLSQ